MARNSAPANGKKIGGDKLGFFSKPYLAESGPDKGMVVKQYRGILTRSEAERTKALHQQFVEKLKEIGIRLLETSMRVVEAGRNKFRVEIVQKPFRGEELAREIIKKASPKECSRIMEMIVEDAVKVIEYNKDRGEKVGFHPTLRNYFISGGKQYYIDTFPPMVGGKNRYRYH